MLAVALLAGLLARIAALAGPFIVEDCVTSSDTDTDVSKPEPIAIIGLGCRFPGAPNVQAYWELLCNGASGITAIPDSRWNADEFYDSEPTAPGKMVSRWGGFLDGLELFDARFFGISPREAAQLDPRQRLIAEVAWESLEDAGVPPLSLAGSRTGVFMAALSANYGTTVFANHLDIVDIYSGTGNGDSVIANRLSYLLDLRGPSLTLHTACSGGLVAIHLACQSLRAGESDMALAGGVSVIARPDDTVFFSKSGALSPDGVCRVFDARANGTVRSEGAGVVVLKPLARAIADGDPVYAVIRGSVVNQDGASSGLMAPNGAAQQAMLREAYDLAGIAPAQVQYIEAHGTGTPLGDPIEVNALGAVLGQGRAAGQHCVLGSAKTNIGHTEAAAGIAGVIKVALAMKHRLLPGNLHFEHPNPAIPFDTLPFVVPTSAMPWPANDRPLIAGVSGFGFSGTNAHVVLTEPPVRAGDVPSLPETPHVLALSARTPDALQAVARSYADFLQHDSAPFAQVCANASLRRSPLEYRMAVVASSGEAARGLLQAALEQHHQPGVTWSQRRVIQAPNVAWVFSGQGSHWAGMGRELLAAEPVFAAAFAECAALIRRYAGFSLEDVLAADAPERLNQTDIAQPAIFTLQVSLAALWRSWGVQPAVVVGQSLGEVAAAYVAGALSLEDAVQVIVHRSRLMKRVAGKGCTAVVGLPLEQARLALTGWEDVLAVAGSSGPSTSVLAGEPAALRRILASLEARQIFCRMVPGVDIAFHSPQMDGLLDELISSLEHIQPVAPTIPIYSTVTGRHETVFDAAYWGRNLREPFLLAPVVADLIRDGYETMLEVSPHPVAVASLKENFGHAGVAGTVVGSLRRGEPERAQLLATLGALWVQGQPVAWRSLHPAALPLTLPTYPWQRERFWYDQLTEGREPYGFRPASARGGAHSRRAGGHPLLGEATALAFPAGLHSWELDLSASSLHYLAHHRVQGMVILPGSAYIEMALAAAKQMRPAHAAMIRHISFRQALLLHEGASRRVQVVVSGESRHDAQFRIFSKPATEPDAEWLLHAEGQIGFDVNTSMPAAEPLLAIQQRCAHIVTGEGHYQTMEAHGQQYGPTFQAVRQVWRRPGEALGIVEVPALLHQELGRYTLHPAVLDACFQVGVLTLPGAGESDASPMRGGVVQQVDGLQVFASPGTGIWCHALLREQHAGGAMLEIALYDAEGTCLARVDSLHLQALEHVPAVQRNPANWLLVPQWVAAPQQQLPTAVRNWLIFADAGGVGEQLANEVRSRGHQAICIVAGASTRRISDTIYEADPRDAEALRTLVTGLTTDGSVVYGGIAHCWSLDIGTPQTVDELEQCQVYGTGSLLAIVQALASATRRAAPVLWMLTAGSQPAGEHAVTAPAQAPVWGFGRVLANEHPELWGGLVDLDPSHSIAPATLLDALACADDERQIAFRHGERYVARLAPTRASTGAEIQFRTDSAYVITGGLGGLGLEVARWMIARGARRLILAGRAALPPRNHWGTLTADAPAYERVAAVRALESLGAHIHYASLDIADVDALQTYFDTYRAEGWPPIRGVIHSAGVVRDQLLATMTAAEFAVATRPKIQGAWALHQALRNEPLEQFVLFSSASSLMGMYGQSNYAAGNAFLDSLAHYRQRLGLPAVSINWGAWAEVGMAARLASDEHLAHHGVIAMPPWQAVAVLGRLMTGEPAQTAVMAMDWNVWRRANSYAERIPFFAPVLAASAPTAASDDRRGQPYELVTVLSAATPAERVGHAEAYVQEVIAGVMRLERARVDLDQPLHTMGLDSIMAVEMKNHVEAQLAVTFSIVELLQDARGSTMVDRIVAAYQQDATVDELLLDIDTLSDDEIAALLTA